MANTYYNRTNNFAAGTKAKGDQVRTELDAVVSGFDLLPTAPRLDSGNSNYVIPGGTADALTITSPGTALTTYTGEDGRAYVIKVASTNTGPITVNVDAVGDVPMVKNSGTAFAAGEIVAGQMYVIIYNETTGKFLNMFEDAAAAAAAAQAAAEEAAAQEAAAEASVATDKKDGDA